MAEQDVDQVVERLVEIYGDAERALRRTLSSADSTDFMRGRASRLLVQVEAITRRLKVQSRRWAAPALTGAYRDASGEIAKDPELVPIAGGGAPRRRRLPTFDLVDKGAVESIAGAMLGDLDRAVDGIPRELNRVFLQTRQEATSDVALLQRVGRARVLGETREQLARDIAQTMRDGATERLKHRLPADVAERLRAIADGKFVPIVGKDGKLRRYDLKKYAELVGHTWMMAAANQAALRMAERAGTDLVRFPVHSGACPLCLKHQGRIYSISGRHPDFPPLNFAMPLHPNCRHRLSPVIEDILRARGTYDALVQFSKSTQTAETVPEYRRMLEKIREQDEPGPSQWGRLTNRSPRDRETVKAWTQEAIRRADLEGFLARETLTSLTFQPKIASGAVGQYDPRHGERKITVATSRPPESYGKPLQPFTGWSQPATSSFSTTGQSIEEAILRTIVHEFSHHLHVGLDVGLARSSLGQRFAEIDGLIHDRYTMAWRRQRGITARAMANAYEYWTETHTAYIFNRRELREHDPDGYDMVRRVRERLGLADLG